MSWSADNSSVQSLSTEEVYQFNQNRSSFLMDSIAQNLQAPSLGTGNYPFKVTVDVRQQTQSSTQPSQTLEALVTCLYISEGVQIDFDTILTRYVDPKQLPYKNVLELSFRPYKATFVLTSSDKGPTKADLGLIVATCFLTVTLVVVSSVLLYITGGWDVCQQKCSNCCFEEVDDDFDIENKSTFQVEDAYDEHENESVENGMVTVMDSVPGVLGAQLLMDHPAAGLGVHTPARSMMDDETATPMSTNQPLGIMSMRKMHPDSPDASGGLTNMIMNRMMPYSNK
jgi:hypothetical protein